MIHRHLDLRWYLWSALREFVLIYPIYAVMMLDAGISRTQLAVLFACWSATALLAEVPAGILADRISRRHTLILGALCKGAGFGCWFIGDFGAFLCGFVAWGIGGALSSGAREALLFESLAEDQRGADFGRIYGRGEALGRIAVATSFVVGGALAESGWQLPLFLSVAAMSASALFVAIAFREPVRQATSVEASDAKSPLGSQLYPAIRELRDTPGLIPLVSAICLLTCTHGVLDEFVPPLLHDQSFSMPTVGWLLAGMALCEALGMGIGGQLARSMETGTAAAQTLVGTLWVYLIGAAALSLATLPGNLWTAGAVGCFFLAGGIGQVTLMSGLQHRQTGATRATTTSIAAFGTEVVAIPLYLAAGMLATATGWVGMLMGFVVATAAPAAALLLLEGRKDVGT